MYCIGVCSLVSFQEKYFVLVAHDSVYDTKLWKHLKRSEFNKGNAGQQKSECLWAFYGVDYIIINTQEEFQDKKDWVLL